MGSGYVIEHCVSAFLKRQEEKLLFSYISDALMAISANTAKCLESGQAMMMRFAEIAGWAEVDERTGDEIVIDIVNRAGLRVSE